MVNMSFHASRWQPWVDIDDVDDVDVVDVDVVDVDVDVVDVDVDDVDRPEPGGTGTGWNQNRLEPEPARTGNRTGTVEPNRNQEQTEPNRTQPLLTCSADSTV